MQDEGQAAVELALVLPLITMVLLALVQCGLIVRDQVLVVHAAREAAREAAVDAQAGAPRQAALASSTLRPERLSVDVGARGPAGSRVQVKVVYRAPTDIPIIGRVVGDVRLTATTTMRVEH